MDFSIEGPNGFIKIELAEVFGFPNHTSHWGGYDTRSKLTLKSRGISVNSALGLSTGEIYNFYRNLEETHAQLSGYTKFTYNEYHLWFGIQYDPVGHVIINGEFREDYRGNNSLKFEIITDQSYLIETLKDLKRIAHQYGDDTGKSLINIKH